MASILVAVDEHPHAEKIVDAAVELAAALSAKILLIYVVSKSKPPENYRDTHGDAIPEHYYEDEYQRTVSPLLRRLEESGVKYQEVTAAGDPQDMILKAAKTKGVSYIVVGARGLRGLSRLKAIGNVSRGVIERSTVPVVAIP
jgi:nucleotide-binding universal stress UspA family protein